MWLNEGFATLYANYIADLVYPEERFMDTFVIDTMQKVLREDIGLTVRPMTHYVESPVKINKLFDFIAYPKCKLNFKIIRLRN